MPTRNRPSDHEAVQSGLRDEFGILITNAALRHLAEQQIPP